MDVKLMMMMMMTYYNQSKLYETGPGHRLATWYDQMKRSTGSAKQLDI